MKMTLADRLAERMKQCGITQAELARSVGVSQQAIGKLVRGDARSSVFLHKIARELETTVEWLTGETEDPTMSLAYPPTKKDMAEDLGVAEVLELDLAYGMGGTYLDDLPVKSEALHFPTLWLRNFTDSPAESLFFARGIGDSMEPTIYDSSLVLIDTAQNSVRMSDQIWAVAYGNVGMIKRLRPLPDGNIAVLSDNPQVPMITAADGEMHIIGRVVAVVRKI